VKRRCVFLDRDGVVNAAPPPGEYLRRWEDFHLMPGVADWIRLFNVLGFFVIIVTNQRGIACGLMQDKDVEEIHRKMRGQLADVGARIDDVFCCPHEEGTCECRKPRIGLVDQACRKWDIDLAGSVLIGDSAADRELARRCGMRFVRVHDGRIVETVEFG
jgi:D-glycero-D-manno-heptose 1,7-bisphosphate phosphatase